MVAEVVGALAPRRDGFLIPAPTLTPEDRLAIIEREHDEMMYYAKIIGGTFLFLLLMGLISRR